MDVNALQTYGYLTEYFRYHHPSSLKKAKQVKQDLNKLSLDLLTKGKKTYDNYIAIIDVFMWYGALLRPGRNIDRPLIKRIFRTLWLGGLVCNSEGKYKQWQATGYPIAMALSHGGRVLIQLKGANCLRFWAWLWGGANNAKTFKRAAATHSITLLSEKKQPAPQPVLGNVNLYMVEAGGHALRRDKAIHCGVNVALGGLGNYNPLSGKLIIPNGQHGHLYLYYRPASGPDAYGGILVGCETSAPPDQKKQDGFDKAAFDACFDLGVEPDLSNVAGTRHKIKHSDTYGGGHGFGAKNIFSATGGLKWGSQKMKQKVGKHKVKVPWRSKVSGGKTNMVVDLITDPAIANSIMLSSDFDPENLGKPGPQQ